MPTPTARLGSPDRGPIFTPCSSAPPSLQGRTMTDFVVAAVQDAARRAIEGADVVRLSLADQECSGPSPASPPSPSPALERAFARRRGPLGAK